MIIAQSALEAILTKENVHQTAYIIMVIMFIYLFNYLLAFLDTGLPRGNVHERDSGPMRGAIPTQYHNP